MSIEISFFRLCNLNFVTFSHAASSLASLELAANLSLARVNVYHMFLRRFERVNTPISTAEIVYLFVSIST